MEFLFVAGSRQPDFEYRARKFEFFEGWSRYRDYLVAVEDGKVAGMVCMVRKSSRGAGMIGIGYCEVAPEYKHQGIAKQLITKLYRMANKAGKGVYVTDYAPEGEQFLKPVIRKLAQLMHTTILEHSEWSKA